MSTLDAQLRTAIRLATDNAAGGGFPFGAIVVRDDEILATGVNTALRDADPTADAEVQAIRAACRRLGAFDLDGAIVVSSCQPCPMCQAVAASSGVARIAYAATAERAAHAGFRPSPVLAATLAGAGAGGGALAVEHFEIEGSDAPFEAWATWERSAAADARRVSMRPVSELRLAVTVDDLDAVVAFYRDAFGLPEIAAWTGTSGRGYLLDAGRATLELIDEPQAELIDAIEVGRRVAGSIRVALEVDDSATMAERLTAAGATNLGEGPVVTPWRDRNVRLAAPGDLQLTLFTVLPAEPGEEAGRQP